MMCIFHMMPITEILIIREVFSLLLRSLINSFIYVIQLFIAAINHYVIS